MSLEKAMFPKKKKNPKYTIELDSDNKDPFPDTGVSSNDVESTTKPSIDGFQNNGYFVAAAKYDLTKDLEGGYVNNGGIFTDEQCDLPDGLIDGYEGNNPLSLTDIPPNYSEVFKIHGIETTKTKL